LQEISSFPKETIGAAELEEIISRLGHLLSNTNWMVLKIQQKLLNVYMQIKMMDSHRRDSWSRGAWWRQWTKRRA
jgi:hypothetical protein